MTDTPPDYRDTVFLPRTDFPMKAGLAAKEPAILERWKRIGVYERLREQRAGRERFILHDGPPYANGDIHMGHAMNKVLKDIVVRSATLLGKDAPFVPGWDCHGLPIEWKVEEAYRAQKRSKEEVPVEQFRAECRAYAERWVAVQRGEFERLGVMGDWDDPYLTMNHDAEAAIVGEFLKFAESGQLYRGAKPVMWSPVERTALAEAEVEYEDIVSTQIDVAFEIVEAPAQPELVGVDAIIWTTTPWTIPVNQALSFGAEIEYGLVRMSSTGVVGWGSQEEARDANPAYKLFGNREFLIATALKEAFEKRVAAALTTAISKTHPGTSVHFRTGIQKTYRGSDLAGAIARHPMHHLGDFFARPRPFLPGDFVTTDAGTGLVHMAPDHGEDDFELCRSAGIEPVFAVDGAGMYRADWAWLGGQGSVINKKFTASDGPICSDLRAAGAFAGGERRLQAQLSAFVAEQGEADLPRHAAMVHPDGRAHPSPARGRGRDPLGASRVGEVRGCPGGGRTRGQALTPALSRRREREKEGGTRPRSANSRLTPSSGRGGCRRAPRTASGRWWRAAPTG